MRNSENLARRLMRHGRSKANEAGRIVSTLENGVLEEWGLSPTGEAQAQAAGWVPADFLAPPPNWRFCSPAANLPSADTPAARRREKLRAELGIGPDFDHSRLAIYASPFTRTMQTARLVGARRLPCDGQLRHILCLGSCLLWEISPGSAHNPACDLLPSFRWPQSLAPASRGQRRRFENETLAPLN